MQGLNDLGLSAQRCDLHKRAATWAAKASQSPIQKRDLTTTFAYVRSPGASTPDPKDRLHLVRLGRTPRCELVPGWSIRVVHAGRYAMAAYTGRAQSPALLYSAAVRASQAAAVITCLQSSAKASSTVHDLARSAPRVHLSPARSKLVGVRSRPRSGVNRRRA